MIAKNAKATGRGDLCYRSSISYSGQRGTRVRPAMSPSSSLKETIYEGLPHRGHVRSLAQVPLVRNAQRRHPLLQAVELAPADPLSAGMVVEGSSCC